MSGHFLGQLRSYSRAGILTEEEAWVWPEAGRVRTTLLNLVSGQDDVSLNQCEPLSVNKVPSFLPSRMEIASK